MANEAQIYALSTCALSILPNRRNAPKSTGPNSQKVLEIPSITLFLFAFCEFLWLKNQFNQRNLCHKGGYPRNIAGRPGLKWRDTLHEIRSTNSYVRNYKKNMQNEPKFRKSQMYVTDLLTREYDKKDTWWTWEKTKPNSKRPK
jgi:hypothetical protein